MGTFHHDKGELHGVTVVVETRDGRLLIGRCDEYSAHALTLNDVGEHQPGPDGLTREEYLRRAAQYGYWKQQPHLALPGAQVVSVRPLGELS